MITVMSTPYPWLTSHLQRAGDLLRQGRMPHALLVTGLPGLGKSAFASHLAALLIWPWPYAHPAFIDGYR